MLTAPNRLEETGHVRRREGEDEVRLDHLNREIEKLQMGEPWQRSPWTWSSLAGPPEPVPAQCPVIVHTSAGALSLDNNPSEGVL